MDSSSSASTPQRRSVLQLREELSELFLDPTTNLPSSIPLSELPALITAYELKRGGQVLLGTEEKVALEEWIQQQSLEMVVDIDDLIGMAMGTPDDSPTSARAPDASRAPEIPLVEVEVPKMQFATTSIAGTETKSTPQRPSSLLPPPSRIATPRLSPVSSSNSIELFEGKYLGVDSSGGDEFDAIDVARKIRTIVKGSGVKEKELFEILGDKTHSQIQQIDSIYQEKYTKSLFESLIVDRLLRGNLDFALRGLILGPIYFDVELLKKAIGVTVNEALLVDILISRSPAEIQILRQAFSKRTISSSSPARQKSLDSTVLAAFNNNLKLRKAFEIVLSGSREDLDLIDDGKKIALIKKDVEELKASLKKGGNHEIAAKILLSRSPSHLNRLVIEYKKATGQTLTKSIKINYSGLMERMLLSTVEHAKKLEDGVWRDAKALARSLDGSSNARSESLIWRLTRLRWDRERFEKVLVAFESKYKQPFLDRLSKETTGHLREGLITVVAGASLPPASKSVAQPPAEQFDSLFAEEIMVPIPFTSPVVISSQREEERDHFADLVSTSPPISPLSPQLISPSTGSFESRRRSTPLESFRPPSVIGDNDSNHGGANDSFKARPKPPRNRRSSVEVGLKTLKAIHDEKNGIQSPVLPEGKEEEVNLNSPIPIDFLSPTGSVKPVEPSQTTTSPVVLPASNSPPIFSLNSIPMDRGSDSLFDESPISKPSSRRISNNSSSSSQGEGGSTITSESRKLEDEILLEEFSRTNHELMGRVKGLEEKLSNNATHFEESYGELQVKLEETKAELSLKKKEEKDLKSTSAQQREQILALEADLIAIEIRIEKSKEIYGNLKKEYEAKLMESERLRVKLTESRDEYRSKSEQVTEFSNQWEYMDAEIKLARKTIKRLELDVKEAHFAQREECLQENLNLKEIIERLNFDLDELRSRSTSEEGANFIAGKRRNLGSEMEEEARIKKEQAGEEQVETVTTTRRIIKKRVDDTEYVTELKTIATTVVLDATTQTDSRTTSTFEIQTDPLLEPELAPRTKAEIQQELMNSLGVEWNQLESFIQNQKLNSMARLDETPIPTTSTLRQRVSANKWSNRLVAKIPTVATRVPAIIINSFPESTRPFVSNLVLYTATIYLGGVVTGLFAGSNFLSGNQNHYHFGNSVSELSNWHEFNGISSSVASSGSGGLKESIFFYLHEIVWSGVAVVRRVPV